MGESVLLLFFLFESQNEVSMGGHFISKTLCPLCFLCGRMCLGRHAFPLASSPLSDYSAAWYDPACAQSSQGLNQPTDLERGFPLKSAISSALQNLMLSGISGMSAERNTRESRQREKVRGH